MTSFNGKIGTSAGLYGVFGVINPYERMVESRAMGFMHDEDVVIERGNRERASRVRAYRELRPVASLQSPQHQKREL